VWTLQNDSGCPLCAQCNWRGPWTHFRSRKVVFSIEVKFCQEAKDNVWLFLFKKVVFRIYRCPGICQSFSPLPWKTVDRENTVFLKGSNNGISHLGFLFLAFIYHILNKWIQHTADCTFPSTAKSLVWQNTQVIMIGRCLQLLPKDRIGQFPNYVYWLTNTQQGTSRETRESYVNFIKIYWCPFNYKIQQT
jgi:hypothetical protein